MRGFILSLLCLPVLLPGVSISGETGTTGMITGVILMDDGRPMSGGKMVFFRKESGPPPRPGRYLRPPDEVAGIDNNGVFAVRLPEGKYYVSAIRKRAGGLIGPPAEGDHVFPNPADLQGGQNIYAVRNGGKTDIGIATAVR